MRVDLVGALIVGVSMLGWGSCGRQPEPAPPPTSTTTTLPAATPDPCPSSVPRIAYVACKDHGAWLDGRRRDCTPQSRVAPLGGYPIWPEDGYRAACERKAAGGEPSMAVSEMTGTLTFKRLGNPYQFALAGEGRAVLHCYVPAEGDLDLCGYEVSLP